MGKPIENLDWWREKVGDLETLAKPMAQVAAGQIYEKTGFWPVLKLVWMRQALGYYLGVMASRRDAGQWGSLHFIDLCAGSGLTCLEPKGNHRKVTVLGSALIGAHGKGFDHYHFVEPNLNAAKALGERLAKLLPQGSYAIYAATSQDAIGQIVANLKTWKNPHFMAFVDPEGLTEVTLPNLESLFRSGRGDFLFNYQYTAVKRVPESVATAFFGSDEWDRSGKEPELVAFFLGRLKAYGRPRSTVIHVAAGKGSGPYAYNMVYCAAATHGDNPWLKKLEADVEKRMAGMDGKMLENVFLGGQRALPL